MGCSYFTKSGILFILGSILIATSAVLVVLWPSLFLNQLKERLALTLTSESFPLWQTTPIPMFLDLYLYNFTNSQEVLNDPNNVLPEFVELGPYVFREIHQKVNLTWNSNNTITFYNNRTWFFEPEMSNGSLSDEVTNINVVTAAACYEARLMSELMRRLFNGVMVLEGIQPLVTKTVRELLFEGYEDPLIDLGRRYNMTSNDMDKFGWFYGRNGSNTFDGIFNMYTGTDNIANLGHIDRWQHMSRTNFFREECGDVKGSTGELFPPTMYDDEVTIFSSDLCTYIPLSQVGPYYHKGIDGVLYAADEKVFDNGHRYSEMECYCAEVRDENCVYSGALNVSTCRNGAPAFVSFPHFYQADPFYLSKIKGMQPNKELDEFRLAVDQFTGMPLYVRAQLQINIMIRHVEHLTVNNRLPSDTFFPMMWFRQEIKMTEEYAATARRVHTLRYAVVYGLYALASLGILLFAIAVILILKYVLKKRESGLLVAETLES